MIIIMFLLRFVDVAAFIPTMAVITTIIPQIAQSYNINPLIWIPLFTMAVNACFLSYQNMFALVAETNFAHNGWSKKHLGLFGSVYFIACIIAMIAAVPYWISIGMF